MSGRDQQDPLHNDLQPAKEQPGEHLTDQNLPGHKLPNQHPADQPLADLHLTDPDLFSPDLPNPSFDCPDPSDQFSSGAESAAIDLTAPAPSDDSSEEPAFYLPAIPIEPTRPIDSPISRVLSSGDHLIDVARDPVGHASSRLAQRDPIPDDLDPALFLMPGAPGPEFGTWETTKPGAPSYPRTSADRVGIQEPQSDIPPPDFHLEPEPESRIPNFGHLILLVVIASLGFLAAGLAVQFAFRFHLWGVTTIDQATNDIHYTLASMAVLYLVSFAAAFFLFPLLWHKPFFAGLQWNAAAALRRIGLLIAAAAFCFVLAMVDQFILPGPTNAPIDKMFSNTSAAWLLFGFGVAVAPFFEEITFRGFLLPALCTTCDWVGEYIQTETRWSRPAFVVGSAVVSSALAGFRVEKFGNHRLPAWALGLPEWFFLSLFIAVVCGLAISWLYQRYQTIGAVSRVRPLGPNGHPQWSLAAMIVGSLLTSLPFAAMHADQIANSIGPLILLYCVSLVLCFARLSTRSLAASTLVHASYNFLLFSLMLWGTGGFKHLDKM